jgi:hypothetical protein
MKAAPQFLATLAASSKLCWTRLAGVVMRAALIEILADISTIRTSKIEGDEALLKEKKSRARSPALKIVSTLFPRKISIDL